MDCLCLGRATTDENNQVIAENHAHDHPPETACTVAKLFWVILHCLTIILIILCKRVEEMHGTQVAVDEMGVNL